MNEIILYQTVDNQTQIEVQFDGETVWLNQQQMSDLFQQTKQNISLHINNCFKEKELDGSSRGCPKRVASLFKSHFYEMREYPTKCVTKKSRVENLVC